MQEEELLNVLSDWNFWGKGTDTGVERKKYVKSIAGLLNDINIIAEIGVRRSGKSFIARQVLASLINEGQDKNTTLIIDLNDERFQKDQELLNKIYEIYRKGVEHSKKTIILIDEPQEIEGWERFVRGVSERGEAKFIVTGSSSKLLSSEFSTLLSGRHVPINVFPLSFAEFLEFKEIKAISKLDIGKNLARILSALDEYTIYGGFPAVVLAKNKNELLNSYVDTILIKDIIGRYKIRDSQKLKILSKFYLTNISNSITYNSISRFIHIPVKTVERFSDYIEGAFLIFFVRRFSFSIKEQENSPRKVYTVDCGLSFSSGFNTVVRKGAVIENIVAIELKRRGAEFYYWKDKTTGKEIDFIVKSGKKYKLIQVSDTIDEPSTFERESGALKIAMKRFKQSKSTLIVYSKPKDQIVRRLSDMGIETKQLWQWLLQGPM